MGINNPCGIQLFHWHLEISTKCTLKCPRCPRTERKGEYHVGEMSLDLIRRIISPDLLKSEVKKILLCGGQGDPIYHSKFHQVVEYIKSNNPEIEVHITTNGSYKSAEWWMQLAELLNENDQIHFSIDGWDQESNQLYRRNCDFESALNGVRIMAKSKALVNWTTIVFKFNQLHLQDIENLARQAGADRFNPIHSMLFGSHNQSYIDPALGYDPLEPDMDQFVSQYGRHERYSKVLRTDKSPRVREYQKALVKQVKDTEKRYEGSYITPLCMSGDRGLYVDVEGIVYPCSWVSHPFGSRCSKHRDKVIRSRDSLWIKHRAEFDLKQKSLEEVLASTYLKKLVNSWEDPSKAFVECENKCLTTDYPLKRINALRSRQEKMRLIDESGR